MRASAIAMIGVAAMMAFTSAADAQDGQITVAVKQTVKPAALSYPNTSVDVIGIKPGMTMSQAETIVGKTMSGQPTTHKVTLENHYRDITALSTIVNSATYSHSSEGYQSITLNFAGPAIGDAVYGIDRSLMFPDPLKAPSVKDIEAALIKKYGPPSMKSPASGFVKAFSWQFSKSGFEHCGQSVSCAQQDLANNDGPSSQSAPKGVVLTITALISPNDGDNTKASSLEVSLEDYQIEVEGYDGLMKELKAAATDYYNKNSHTSAAPKL